MIDVEFIEELREMSKVDKKKAKNELADYAQSMGIDVKRSLSFENMLKCVEDEFAKLEAEMVECVPEVGTENKTSITDLINAADKADGKIVFDEVSDDLVKIFEEEIPEQDVQTQPEEIVAEEPKESASEYPTTPVDELEPLPMFEPEITHDELPKQKENVFCDLTNFRPTISLIGGGRGYYTCPWWIFEWIQNNPDWKEHPERFPHSYVLDTLRSLIYYIKRDGSVKVRETKFSQFHTLY